MIPRASLFSVLLAVAAGTAASSLKTAKLSFPNGKTIVVELALTPDERETGLMFRTELPKDYGMLFVFPKQEGLQFWMKNTWTSLDMVFIGEDKKVTAIFRDVPRSYPETPDKDLARRGGLGRYVLELPAGACARYHLRKGDRLAFGIDKK